jgi:hypothetical protein
MYNHDGHNIFVIDGHMHFWDANPENWKNKYGESWIKCFHAFHSGLSPAEEVWPFDKFCRYGEQVLVNSTAPEPNPSTYGLRVGGIDQRAQFAPPARQAWCRSALLWSMDLRSVERLERQ